jgi:hypothetical protein
VIAAMRVRRGSIIDGPERDFGSRPPHWEVSDSRLSTIQEEGGKPVNTVINASRNLPSDGISVHTALAGSRTRERSRQQQT